ncbi:hypothetical protein LOZ86_03550 [Pectobacterium parvum]|uniref:Uncharacterized protein n=2 Tax=Pectobacterium parvum TaxID=2778550 RepID=A0AAP9IHA6_9GAMM|nr:MULTISPECIES: hypothetical protein [Pectobacterium]MCU1803356.1 hypothetical protein [Pectobacterium parvum]QHQ24333.1 hypothetical protein GMX10_09810 [Pectobacterium parvum]UFK39972.1 hypothetical protein LOZ86_03550 [Pectobacterium parvum]GKW43660.1 hypothetical protein PEC301879_35180 [Pectobacterium carotovorum subsp. carotovorum]
MFREKTLKNKITGSTINVKNIDADFCIVLKEKSLVKEIEKNSNLAGLANINEQKNSNTRLWSIGMAVSAISNSDLGKNRFYVDRKVKEKADEICDKNPRDGNVKDVNFDRAINKRGEEYIRSFLNAKTDVDSTNYATGLRAASDLVEYPNDLALRKHFGFLWEQRLAKLSNSRD